jgi:hypothetical protein
MARNLTCDICGKVTTEIVGKLFYAPMSLSRGAKSFHNNYQLHADVGACCGDKLPRLFKWRQRMTASEYAAARRRSNG